MCFWFNYRPNLSSRSACSATVCSCWRWRCLW